MVPLSELWAPILLASVLVFVASSLIWTVLPFHRQDYRKLPDEPALADALRRQGALAGEYVFPCPSDPRERKDPAFLKRMEEGPVGFLTLAKPGDVGMGKKLVTWFLYVVVVSIFVAYLAAHTLPGGTEYLQVFRVVGTAAILAYSGAAIPAGIWYSRPWGNVFRSVIDGVVYGLLTAGTFGWLWPR